MSVMEEPGRLQSIGSQRVRHNWNSLVCMHVCGQRSWDETLEMRGSKNWVTPEKCKLSGMLVGCRIGSYTNPGTKILKGRFIVGRWMDEAMRRGSQRVWKLQCWLGTSMSVGSSSQAWGADCQYSRVGCASGTSQGRGGPENLVFCLWFSIWMTSTLVSTNPLLLSFGLFGFYSLISKLDALFL